MVHGKPNSMGLGSYPDVSLAEARKQAAEYRSARRNDPRKVRDDKRPEKVHGPTLRQVVEELIERKKAAWVETYAKEWRRNFKQYVYPIKTERGQIIGDLPVKLFDTEIVLKVLEPLWARAPIMGRHVQIKLATVFSYARARYRMRENPAQWRDHLEHMLARPWDIAPVRHLSALPYPDAPDFLSELRLRRRKSVSKDALELILHTLARISMAVGAEWDEIIWEERKWAVPISRMKARRNVPYPNGRFEIPLSDSAIDLLLRLHKTRRGKYIFPGGRPGGHISREAVRNLTARMNSDITNHGFRATFRTWSDKRTVCEWEVKEMALGHSVGKDTEAAYARDDWYEKRSILMDVWAEFLETGSDVPVIIGFREEARVATYREKPPVVLGITNLSKRSGTWAAPVKLRPMGSRKPRREREHDGIAATPQPPSQTAPANDNSAGGKMSASTSRQKRAALRSCVLKDGPIKPPVLHDPERAVAKLVPTTPNDAHSDPGRTDKVNRVVLAQINDDQYEVRQGARIVGVVSFCTGKTEWGWQFFPRLHGMHPSKKLHPSPEISPEGPILDCIHNNA